MASTFIVHLAGWAGALVAAQIALGAAGGGPVLSHIPVWAGFALVLAAYPAGIAISAEALGPGRPSFGSLLRFAALLAGLGVAMLLVLGWIGPGLAVSGTPEGDLHRLDLGTLYRRARAALRAAELATGPPTVERWLEANQLAWSFVSRLAGAALAILMAALGVLVGYWSSRTPRADLRRLQQWIVGLCLVVTTYLAGENSYELILLHAAGPVYPIAWLRLVAPAVLLCGLSWATVVALWHASGDQPGPWT